MARLRGDRAARGCRQPRRRRRSAPSRRSASAAIAYGLQYHVELTPTTVADWGAVPAYQDSLERALGPDGLAPFEAEAARNMPSFNRDARILYDNFIGVVRGA